LFQTAGGFLIMLDIFEIDNNYIYHMEPTR